MKLSFYQNIRIFPDEETGSREIGEVLFHLLHLAFVENKDPFGNSRFAISFPEYSKGGNGGFGRFFRVFAYDKESLIALNLAKLCNKLSGYAECSDIAKIPQVHSFLRFYRVQQKTNSESLARRLARRKGFSIEEARDAYKNFKPTPLCLPYFRVKSNSTNQSFILLINCNCETEEKDGTFNLYGLSSDGNVPDF